jgi:hypothetical protein
MSRPPRHPTRQVGDRPRVSSVDPELTQEGVTFHMTYQGKSHEVQLPRATLQDLSNSDDASLNLLLEYQRHSARIQGVAGRILSARNGASPIILKSDFFR